MVFENEGMRVIVPLDPAEGEQYTEPMREEDDVDHIYKLTTRDEDWINPKLMVCFAGRKTMNTSLTPMGR